MAELTSEDADSRSQLLESSTSLAQVVMEGATKLRTSNFFDSTKCRVPALRQRVKLTVNSKRSFTSTMQVQGFHGRAAKKCIKLHKSVLDHVSFVRQVDRKFILVSVKQADGSHKGRSSDLLLISMQLTSVYGLKNLSSSFSVPTVVVAILTRTSTTPR